MDSSVKVDKHAQICSELTRVYEKKNSDYGDSFARARKIIPMYTAGKLYDKVSRYITLLQQEARVEDETIEDTLMDLANYAIMELIERQNNR